MGCGADHDSSPDGSNTLAVIRPMLHQGHDVRAQPARYGRAMMKRRANLLDRALVVVGKGDLE